MPAVRIAQDNNHCRRPALNCLMTHLPRSERWPFISCNSSSSSSAWAVSSPWQRLCQDPATVITNNSSSRSPLFRLPLRQTPLVACVVMWMSNFCPAAA
ncbi:hypothetical protein ACLKA7_006422 [Drosophila subpalustris]